MDKRLLISIPLALAFTLWPTVGARIGVPGALLGAIVMTTTSVVTVVMARGQFQRLDPFVTLAIIALGIYNGWGCSKYPTVIQQMGSRGGILIALVAIGICLFSAGLSIPLLGYRPTPRDLLGFGFGSVAIWLLAVK